MDLATLVGLMGAFAVVIGAMMLSGTVGMFVDIASLMIVLAGAFGAINYLFLKLPSSIGILIVSLLGSFIILAADLALLLGLRIAMAASAAVACSCHGALPSPWAAVISRRPASARRASGERSESPRRDRPVGRTSRAAPSGR